MSTTAPDHETDAGILFSRVCYVGTITVRCPSSPRRGEPPGVQIDRRTRIVRATPEEARAELERLAAQVRRQGLPILDISIIEETVSRRLYSRRTCPLTPEDGPDQ